MGDYTVRKKSNGDLVIEKDYAWVGWIILFIIYVAWMGLPFWGMEKLLEIGVKKFPLIKENAVIFDSVTMFVCIPLISMGCYFLNMLVLRDKLWPPFWYLFHIVFFICLGVQSVMAFGHKIKGLKEMVPASSWRILFCICVVVVMSFCAYWMTKKRRNQQKIRAMEKEEETAQTHQDAYEAQREEDIQRQTEAILRAEQIKKSQT